MALVAGQSEWMKQAALNANKYRKPNLQQQLRGSILSDNKPASQSEDPSQPESIHKSRLALLKAGAIREANKQAGAYIGTTVGGTIGSAIPVVGTAVGAFIGRLAGKKLGITGIIITIILMILFFIILFAMMIKGYCDSWTGWATNWFSYITTFGNVDICAPFQK